MKFFRQKSLISIFILSILLVFLNSSLQQKNIVVAGALNRQEHCFKITNINEYPDYLFIVLIKSNNPLSKPSNEVLKSTYCFYASFSSYQTYGEVYALKKSEVNLEEDIIKNVDEQTEIEKLKDFESQRAKLIPAKNKIYSLSQIIIGRGGDIPPINDYFEISSISDSALVLKDKKKFKIGSSFQIFSILGNLLLGGALFSGIIYWKKSNNSNKIK